MQSKPRPQPEENHLLAALAPAVQGRLFPHLELVPLSLRSVLYEGKSNVQHVYFPTDSIISIQYELEDGRATALSVAGNEGFLGIELVLSSQTAQSRSIVQSAGYALRLERARLKTEFDRHEQFNELVLRYAQATMCQISQSGICNRHHSIYQQLCRWLLLSMDRLSHNRLSMTQEFIGSMLGVRREGVTESALRLAKAGVISYKRGMIEVRDRATLEREACECYEVVRSETELILEYLPQRRVDLPAPPVVKLPTELAPNVEIKHA
ncbi:MAG: Crp/Fnr family transcriptional regulator [Gammaproteobacteria bacterium]|nr:Crp/Fnr family transcriptional regulator [Gammaproteobacteria bacterium]